jgi:signal transduction histidine kinase
MRDEVPMIYSVYYAEAGADRLSSASLPIPLHEAPPLATPALVFRTVIDKRAGVAVNRHVDAYMFHNDPYISERAPESFACLPIIAQGKAMGAVYLEHARLAGVFTEEQMNTAGTIVTQATPFLENAIYYAEMSNYAKTVERRLQEHIGSLNTLIAGIAHEINSPVGVCVTVLSRMKEATEEVMGKFAEGKLGKNALTAYMDEMKKGIDIGASNVSRAAGLIQNFKKMSVDQSSEVFEWLDLPKVIADVVEYVRPAVKNQIGTTEINAPDALNVFSCSGCLAQVFTNLIMNAAIHAFENMPKADCKITIKIEQTGANAQIIFTDNGKGMSDEELDKLFQPFYTTKRNRGGSGLGTHIILTLVTQTLGGSVKCVSKPGKGTSFIIALPIEKSG